MPREKSRMRTTNGRPYKESAKPWMVSRMRDVEGAVPYNSARHSRGQDPYKGVRSRGVCRGLRREQATRPTGWEKYCEIVRNSEGL